MMVEKAKEAIKEGDHVMVPYVSGQGMFGRVLYIVGRFAEVRIENRAGGKTGQRKQYRVDELKKTRMMSEKEAKEAWKR